MVTQIRKHVLCLSLRRIALSERQKVPEAECKSLLHLLKFFNRAVNNPVLNVEVAIVSPQWGVCARSTRFLTRFFIY